MGQQGRELEGQFLAPLWGEAAGPPGEVILSVEWDVPRSTTGKLPFHSRLGMGWSGKVTDTRPGLQSTWVCPGLLLLSH